MERRIGLKVGQIVNYLGKKHEVTAVYPYIAYLKPLDSLDPQFCVGIGDLVIGGVEPSGKGPVTSPLLNARVAYENMQRAAAISKELKDEE